ncbi:hypothetical protein BDP27DRAFT_1318300 [Rhodocollybia butyracea]|uniref:Uncharacterized protein n=1 Tax=Rhodocollybia butyracea TaxID=206335 RepID=A0A9P5Q2I8_9AGAR|nr:hypothetical protein BDP27DRAFT_1318300 [Rhodocollybia butyracea]
MDELLHHCLRELAFDGDLGCDVSRLADFIKDFYAQIAASNQKVDDAFCAFVWSLVVQQPTVLVGTIPPGITSKVWIAPQVSAKRKASARGEEHVLTEPPALDLVPDAKSRPLADLQREYGDSLRLAGDRDSIYLAITGTHVRFPKMSPMVYSSLQVITRGRDDGVTVVQLGQATKYDQKTCFYLVKQLTDLNLVVKVRRGGVGTHFVIHRYFFERNAHWRAIRDEELRAELESRTVESSLIEAQNQEEEESADVASLGFTPIDARHLSSLPLVRGRVVKLLKASTNHIHVSNNMLVTIGFAKPTKTDRRFFQRRVHELIQQGVIEKVLVPSQRKKSKVPTVLCLRLVDESATGGDGAVVVPPTQEDERPEDDPTQGGFKFNVTIHKQISDLLEESGTKGMTLTELTDSLCQFDRRTVELILTRAERFQPPPHLGDLGVAALLETSGRERRHRYFTVSAYRTLVERENLDRSTAGYGDVDLENVGGFWHVEPTAFYEDEEAFQHYQDTFKDDSPAKLAKTSKKALKSSGPSKRRSKKAAAEGEEGTEAQGSASNVTTARRLGKRKAVDVTETEQDQAEGVEARPPKRRRINKDGEAAEAEIMPPEDHPSISTLASPKKRGRPKKSTSTAEVTPSVPKKLGRPRKSVEIIPGPPKKRGRPRKSTEAAVDTPGPSSPKKRGRPPKPKPEPVQSNEQEREDGPVDGEDVAPKKRGRPRKYTMEATLTPDPFGALGPGRSKPGSAEVDETDEYESEEDSVYGEEAPPKKRGRRSRASGIVEGGDEEQDGTLRRSARASSSIKRISNKIGDSEDEDELAKDNDVDVEVFDAGPSGQSRLEDQEEGDGQYGTEKEMELAPTQSEQLDVGVVQPMSVDAADQGSHEDVVMQLVEAPVEAAVPSPMVANDSTSQVEPLEGRDNVPANERVPVNEVPVTQSTINDIGVSQAGPSESHGGLDSSVDPLPMDMPQSISISSALPPPSPSRVAPQTPTPSVDLSRAIQTPSRAGQTPVPSTSHASTPFRSASRPKVNVSNLRRENELLRVVEMLGGIVNLQTKDFYDAHVALLDTLAKAGEPASSPPGTRTDKRTVTATFNLLESRGKVKQLTTSVPMYLGANKQTVLVYLPHITDDQLSTFLSDLAQSVSPPPLPQPSGRIIDEPIKYGQEKQALRKHVPVRELEKVGIDGPDRWGKNPERAAQLFAQDEALIRDVLLTERTTICQAYGSIIAKCKRARELHLISLRAFETGHSSLQIVSHSQKIIHLSFLSHDLPLGQYCKLVSPTVYVEELSAFMATEEGVNTIVRDLPDNIKNILQVGKARANSKLLDNLEMLRCLGIATPLVAATSNTPLLTCEARENHPTEFQIASLQGWSAHSPLSAPGYWKFHDLVPIHHWAKAETDPPFLQDVSVSTLSQVVDYWALLEDVCLHRSMEAPSQGISNAAPLNATVTAGRTLRRPISWNSSFKLSWHQTQYLKRFYNILTGGTPTDAEIDKISWVISAPSHIVRDYYIDIRRTLAKEAERARKKLKRKAEEKEAVEAQKAKASLKQKAEEARRQRESEWTQLLQHVNPEPVKRSASLRVNQIRERFMQSTTVHDTQKWEAEISNVIREAEMISKKALPKKKTPNPVASSSSSSPRKAIPLSTIAPPVAVNPPERSVAELVADQGPAITPKPPKQPRRKRGEEKQPEEGDNKPRPVNRRHRFMWTREYEELARDAAAVIKGRCRDAIRLEWAALEQVFPAATGGETYLNRLEDSWYQLWVQHRGSIHLPDDDFRNPSNFDLIKHIEFLRKHIDKNALRVGYMPVAQQTQLPIPSSVSSLLEQYDVVESLQTTPSWEPVWNAVVEEGRERGMLGLPFTNQLDVLPLEESPAEEMCLAEAALKIVLGTPNEVYKPDVASALLTSVGEECRNVLSKLVRDPQKSQPGRLLKISEFNVNALNGIISRDTFQDAAALEDDSAQQDTVWRDWPLLATDGDLANLLQLVSENKVEFNIDTSHPKACRPALDWNSKKSRVRFFGLEDSASTLNDAPDATGAMDVDEDPALVHGRTVDGLVACCRKNILGGVVDCSACLDELWKAHRGQLNARELSIAELILWRVGQAGAQGMLKRDLLMNNEMPPEEVLPVLFKMTGEPHPFLHWAGYNSTRLVSSAHAKSWTVALSDSPLTRVFPRRWLDIFGKKMTDIWGAALRAVIGAIVLRPGISQSEIRWRLKSVYDKQEVAEILKILLEEDFIQNRFVSTFSVLGAIKPHAVASIDESEEKPGVLVVNQAKHWYSV